MSASASTVVRSLAGHERLPRLVSYFVGAVVVLALQRMVSWISPRSMSRVSSATPLLAPW